METTAYKKITQFASLDLTIIEQSSDHICYQYADNRLYVFSKDSFFRQTLNHLDLIHEIHSKLSFTVPQVVDSGQSDDICYLLVTANLPAAMDSPDSNCDRLAADLVQFFKELEKIEYSIDSLADGAPIDFNLKIEELQKIIADQPCGNDQKVYTDILNQGLAPLEPISKSLIYGHLDCLKLAVQDSRLIGINEIATPLYGDVAYNYALGYHCLAKESRDRFFTNLGCDEATKKRARNWALYQALSATPSDNPAALKTLYHIFEEYYS